MSGINKSFLKDVKVEDVMEKLKADNYFDKANREMTACVKDTLAYKQMRELAIKNMFHTFTNTPRMTREEKTNQLRKIGQLASQVSSSIFETISERLQKEATIIAERTLKELSDKSSGNSESESTGSKINHYDEASTMALKAFEISQKTNKRNKKGKKGGPEKKNLDRPLENMEPDVFLDGISDKSVSSVHTSDLSSFDDEIVVSSEDEKGEKIEKRISFKTADKVYFDEGFANIWDVISRQKKKGNKAPKKASKGSKTKKQSLPDCSENVEGLESISPRPKRERKPNSKYSAEELC